MTGNSENLTRERSFPFYLFQLWENQKTGRLKVNTGAGEQQFCLVKGELTPITRYFPEKDFLDWLQETHRLEPPLRFNHQLIGAENINSLMAILIEQGFLPSREALELSRDFLVARLIDHFSLPGLRFSFEEEEFSEEDILIKGVFVPDLILQGFRKLAQIEAFSRLLPSEKQLIIRQVPAYFRKLSLKAPELYIWKLLQTPKTFKALLEQSWLGPAETKKTLLALTCLKLIQYSPNPETPEVNGRNSLPDIEKSLALFNEKNIFICRYLAKQLGPVAYNLIEKCYRETVDYLDPIFLNLEFRPDGSLEPRAMLKMSLNELSPEAKKTLLQGFDEILVAELLLVKRNLGNQHEEALVKHLNKIGETA